MLRSLQGAATVALLCLVAGACSNESVEGDVKCTDGVCEPKAVFARGKIQKILVTPETVYAADGSSCGVYAAEKPIEQAARVLATNACGVASLARTDWGIFWSTLTRKDIADRDPKGVLAWVPDGETTPTVVDATLSRPGGIAAIGDTVFVAVADGIRMLTRGTTQLVHVVDATEPRALHAFGGALYWQDALGGIYEWRTGEAKASKISQTAPGDAIGTPTHDDRFVVDASGIYWLSGEFFGQGGDLLHTPLAGGKPEKIADVGTGVMKSLAVDDGAIYWAVADSFLLPKKTTIHRMPKSSETSRGTAAVVVDLAAGVEALQSAPEGLYIVASQVLQLDKDKPIGLQAYGGPLLMLPRAVLETQP